MNSMAMHFLLAASSGGGTESNIYADKSALALAWILTNGIEKPSFSIREVARDLGISLGQIQKVFSVLSLHGYIESIGVRTAKTFALKKPRELLQAWLDHYSILNKCKGWGYTTGFPSRDQLLAALKKSHLEKKVVLALHSAAEVHGCKNTNLQTLELYLLDPTIRSEVEKVLQLAPQERGYEVLLIKPYYKAMVKESLQSKEGFLYTSPLLTFLDLYHFPLRGQEQAEFMAERIEILKQINKRDYNERRTRSRR